jgi:hypothetical protein
MTTPRPLPDPASSVFRALLAGGPQTAHELAERTGLEERHVRDWLGTQAEHGNVTYDLTAQIFLITPQQEARVASEAGQAGGAATSASCRSDMPITARCPSRSSR